MTDTAEQDIEIIRCNNPGEFIIRQPGRMDIAYRADEVTCKSLRRLEWKAARAHDDNDYDELIVQLDTRLKDLAKQIKTMMTNEQGAPHGEPSPTDNSPRLGTGDESRPDHPALLVHPEPA